MLQFKILPKIKADQCIDRILVKLSALPIAKHWSLSIWCIWWHISAIACLIMSSYQIVTYSFVTEYILKPCSCPINAIQYLTSRHNIWKIKLLKDRYIWKVESWYNFSQVNVIIWKTYSANYVDLSESYVDLLDHYVDFADILLSSSINSL